MQNDKSFDEIKSYILKRGKEMSSCQGEYERAIKSVTTEELLLIVKDNLSWISGKIENLATELEELFGTELLFANHIYTSGKHNLSITEKTVIITLGSSSATVKTLGSSSATVKTLGSSSATVKTLGSSSANVETWDSSSANVETWGSSSANVETWGSSSANVETWGSSSKLTHSLGDGACPSIKDLSQKKLFVKTSDFEIVQIQ